jgi:type I restriction enzyme S subunit
MSREFFSLKLSEIADVVAGQSPESIYYSNIEGVPFLQGNRTFGTLYPSIDTFTSKVTKLAKKDEVLMSVRAPVGDLNFAPCDLCIGRGLASIKAKNGNHKFIYYALKYNIKNLLRQGSGTTFDSVNKDVINELELIIPEDKEARNNVTKVLSDLDSKIELNNRINAELEAMAKTLYDYWFVQFDFPDKNGKPYKTSGGTLVWNEELKREIPEGWEVKELHKIAKCLMGQSPKGESYNQDGIGTPLLNGPADYENGALKGRTYTTEPTRLCQKDDLVLCIRATIGNLVYSEQEFCLGRGVAAVRANDKRLSELIYFLLIQEIERFKVQATGSIIVGITKDDLIESNCLIPKDDLINFFHNLIKPQFDKVRINLKENQKLTELRDWLLPMLMNGQVKVN